MKINGVRLVVLTIASFVMSAAIAQNTQQQKDTTVTRKIQIERDYVPELEAHKRVNVDLPVQKPVVKELDTKYSDYTLLLDPHDESAAIKASKPCDTTLQHDVPKRGFFRAGFGPTWNELVDFWYPVLDDGSSYFDVGIHHHGFIQAANEKKGRPLSMWFNTGVGLNFSQRINANTLYVNLGYSNDYYNYYGTDSLHKVGVGGRYQLSPEKSDVKEVVLDRQNLNRFSLLVGMKSNGLLSNNWYYNASLGYNMVATSMAVSEHNIVAQANTGVKEGKHCFDINLGIDTYIYGNRWGLGIMQGSAEAPYFAAWKNFAVIELAPAYVLKWKTLNLRAGIKADFSIGKGQFFAISPDLQVDYTVKDIVNFFAGVTGDYQANSLNNTLRENRYYAIDRPLVRNTWVPVDAYFGFKVKPVKGLNVTADVRYQLYRDALFFRNNEYATTMPDSYAWANNFAADVAEKANLLTAGVKASYNHNERFMVYAGMRYGKWSISSDTTIEAWHKPSWTFVVGGEAKIYKGLSAHIDFSMATKSKTRLGEYAHGGEIVKVGAMYDLNIGADYKFNNNWSVFADFRNLTAFGTSYQYWYGYTTMVNFNAIAGVRVSF